MVETPGGNPHENRFRRQSRIRHQRDFDAVWQSRNFAADPMLVINARMTGPDCPPRLGLSIGRKVGNAVVRNRWKRLIREAFRTQQRDLPQGIDLVVRPKAGATPDFAQIRISLVRLAWQLTRRHGKTRPPEIQQRSGRKK